MSQPTESISHLFDLEHKQFEIKIAPHESLELYVDGCLRKRDATKKPVLYVWTNIELLWEEHKYVEARYNRTTEELTVTVNRNRVNPR